jgi:hypothetical protein
MANSVSSKMNVIVSRVDMYLLFNKIVSDLVNKKEANKSSLQKLCRAVESEQHKNCGTPQTVLKMKIRYFLYETY